MGTGDAAAITNARNASPAATSSADVKTGPASKVVESNNKKGQSNTVQKAVSSKDAEGKSQNVLKEVVVVAKPTTVKTYKYPLDLPKNYHFNMMFGEYDRDVALSIEPVVANDLMISLPLPANLIDATSLDYSNVELGALGGEMLQSFLRVANAYENGDVFQQLKQETNGLVQNLVGKNGDLRQVLARRLVSSVSPTLGSAFDITTGATLNPHMAVAFNNVKLRTFTYAWKMSPNSPDESAELQNIIAQIQARSLPKKQGKLLLRYPNQCLLEIVPDGVSKLFAFKPCVVTGVNVNYAPQGTPSFFKGTQLPVEIDLAISFQEIQIRTAEDYEKLIK
jgi:hypothetical protein